MKNGCNDSCYNTKNSYTERLKSTKKKTIRVHTSGDIAQACVIIITLVLVAGMSYDFLDAMRQWQKAGFK
jgi:hypothetical protein